MVSLQDLEDFLFCLNSCSGFVEQAKGLEMDAISSAVIGGTLLSGGVGTPFRNTLWCTDQRNNLKPDHNTGNTVKLVGKNYIVSIVMLLHCTSVHFRTCEEK